MHQGPYISTAAGARVHRSASVQGAVSLGARCVVETGAALLGDAALITLGGDVVVGAHAVLKPCAAANAGATDEPLVVGSCATVGDYAFVSARSLGDSVSVGAHAVVGARAVVHDGARVMPWSTVPPDCVVPPGAVVRGVAPCSQVVASEAPLTLAMPLGWGTR